MFLFLVFGVLKGSVSLGPAFWFGSCCHGPVVPVLFSFNSFRFGLGTCFLAGVSIVLIHVWLSDSSGSLVVLLICIFL